MLGHPLLYRSLVLLAGIVECVTSSSIFTNTSGSQSSGRISARNLFSPIAVDQPQPAGGYVQTDSPPLASFFAGMNPPVGDLVICADRCCCG
jgi:hypothetical protein